LVHQLSKKNSDKPFRKLPGIPVTAVFHPSKKIFFVATKKFVQVYDLSKGQRIKKLETGVREISSISIHPGGKMDSC
jgi:ribosome biogenesis protein ERB1